MSNTTKTCYRCKQSFDVSLFAKNKSKKDGLSIYCKTCSNLITRTNRANRSGSANVVQKEYRKRTPIERWAYTTKRNHRQYDVNIDIKDIISMGYKTTHCPLCGCKLDYSVGKGTRKFNSPSLDRINNESYLDKNNVWIICAECNTRKGAHTLSEFILYCETVIKNMKEHY